MAIFKKELGKYTDEDTPEFKKINEGLEAMKSVTGFINELKKRRESMMLVQQLEPKIENWAEVNFFFKLIKPLTQKDS